MSNRCTTPKPVKAIMAFDTAINNFKTLALIYDSTNTYGQPLKAHRNLL